MDDNVFAQLQLGINFDKKRFKKQIDLFECKKHNESASGLQFRMHVACIETVAPATSNFSNISMTIHQTPRCCMLQMLSFHRRRMHPKMPS